MAAASPTSSVRKKRVHGLVPPLRVLAREELREVRREALVRDAPPGQHDGQRGIARARPLQHDVARPARGLDRAHGADARRGHGVVRQQHLLDRELQRRRKGQQDRERDRPERTRPAPAGDRDRGEDPEQRAALLDEVRGVVDDRLPGQPLGRGHAEEQAERPGREGHRGEGRAGPGAVAQRADRRRQGDSAHAQRRAEPQDREARECQARQRREPERLARGGDEVEGSKTDVDRGAALAQDERRRRERRGYRDDEQRARPSAAAGTRSRARAAGARRGRP